MVQSSTYADHSLLGLSKPRDDLGGAASAMAFPNFRSLSVSLSDQASKHEEEDEGKKKS